MLFTLRGKKRMQEMMTAASDAGERFSSALVQMLSKVKVESSQYPRVAEQRINTSKRLRSSAEVNPTKLERRN